MAASHNFMLISVLVKANPVPVWLAVQFYNLFLTTTGFNAFPAKQKPECEHHLSWWRHQMETISALLALCPVNSPHKGQWRGAWMFSLICTRINGWVNNGEAGDLRRYRAHHDVTVMYRGKIVTQFIEVYMRRQAATCLTYRGRDKMATIFQTTYSNEFSWMKMYKRWLRFHWSSLLRVQLTIFQHWFR